MKSNKGISLLVLVITIVVIIILSAVVIRTAIGDNGIINKATEAKDEFEKTAEEEDREMNSLKDERLTRDELNNLPKEISFEIVHIDVNYNHFATYDLKAERGTTWGKWINTDYNRFGVRLYEIKYGLEKRIYLNDPSGHPGYVSINENGSSMINPNTKITDGATYYVNAAASKGEPAGGSLIEQ